MHHLEAIAIQSLVIEAACGVGTATDILFSSFFSCAWHHYAPSFSFHVPVVLL
jgi:hypothetical protein